MARTTPAAAHFRKASHSRAAAALSFMVTSWFDTTPAPLGRKSWLHFSQLAVPVSRKTTQQALLHMKRLEPFLRALATSDLREKLLLVEGPAEDGSGSFVVQLEMIREQLEVVACHATGRENQLFNNMMSLVVAYVLRQTGQFHDDNLSAIIKLMGDGKFNCEGWRKRHRSWTPRITALRAPSPKRRSTA